jgi:hypothetical protein
MPAERDYLWDVDELGNVKRGRRLAYAYQGAHAVMLVDREGRGYRFIEGQQNLREIVGTDLVLEDDDETVAKDVPDVVDLERFKKAELVKFAEARDIETDNLTKAQIIAALRDSGEPDEDDDEIEQRAAAAVLEGLPHDEANEDDEDTQD